MLRRFRTPHHVEGVAENWHRTDYAIERDVGEHAHDDMPGCS
jgi:hypothetical protein